MRILVPLDGSDLAEEAMGAAMSLAARHRAEVHLISVVPLAAPASIPLAQEPFQTDWIERETARAREYLETVSAEASSHTPGVPVKGHVSVGRVSSTVQGLAGELNADLLVTTTHGRGAFKRSWLGSVADQLLRRIEQPILLLRRDQMGRWKSEAGFPRHVLVPLDGSPAAECALDPLHLVLPQEGDVRVTLAYVVEEGFPIPIHVPSALPEGSMKEESERQAETYLRGVADELDSNGVDTVETRVIFAESPSQGLLRFCEEGDIDLVAISTHGAGGVTRLLLGSVADKLIRGAPVPVLVSKRPADEQD